MLLHLIDTSMLCSQGCHSRVIVAVEERPLATAALPAQQQYNVKALRCQMKCTAAKCTLSTTLH